MILLVGDFNVNSLGKPLPTNRFKDLNWVKSLKVDTFMEYDYMMAILSDQGKHKLIDLAYWSSEKHPVTFADTHEHEDGTKKPKETHLTNPSEYYSQQSLDYMF